MNFLVDYDEVELKRQCRTCRGSGKATTDDDGPACPDCQNGRVTKSVKLSELYQFIMDRLNREMRRHKG